MSLWFKCQSLCLLINNTSYNFACNLSTLGHGLLGIACTRQWEMREGESAQKSFQWICRWINSCTARRADGALVIIVMRQSGLLILHVSYSMSVSRCTFYFCHPQCRARRRRIMCTIFHWRVYHFLLLKRCPPSRVTNAHVRRCALSHKNAYHILIFCWSI